MAQQAEETKDAYDQNLMTDFQDRLENIEMKCREILIILKEDRMQLKEQIEKDYKIYCGKSSKNESLRNTKICNQIQYHTQRRNISHRQEPPKRPNAKVSTQNQQYTPNSSKVKRGTTKKSKASHPKQPPKSQNSQISTQRQQNRNSAQDKSDSFKEKRQNSQISIQTPQNSNSQRTYRIAQQYLDYSSSDE